MSYLWQICTVHRDARITAGEYALCTRIKFIPGELKSGLPAVKIQKSKKSSKKFKKNSKNQINIENYFLTILSHLESPQFTPK
jgi:hypothetical protein